MTYDNICVAVKKVKRQYNESNPFRLCQSMGIFLIPQSFGTAEDAIKGFFVKHNRIKTITYNSDLPEVIQRIIIFHEIGHAVLHKDSGLDHFHDVGLFDESIALEKDANIFAAEYLLDDEEVLETLNADNTFFTAAAQLYVPVELLDFKFRILKWKGYKLVEPPITTHNNFLKDIDIPKEINCCF